VLGALALLGALLCATMIRFAPGYGVDERELDSRLSQNPGMRFAVNTVRPRPCPTTTVVMYLVCCGRFGRLRLSSATSCAANKGAVAANCTNCGFGLLAAWIGSSILGLLAIVFQTLC